MGRAREHGGEDLKKNIPTYKLNDRPLGMSFFLPVSRVIINRSGCPFSVVIRTKPNLMHVPWHLWRLSSEASHDEDPDNGKSDPVDPGPGPMDKSFVEEMIIRQLKSWQLDTEVQAAIHSAEKTDKKKMN